MIFKHSDFLLFFILVWDFFLLNNRFVSTNQNDFKLLLRMLSAVLNGSELLLEELWYKLTIFLILIKNNNYNYNFNYKINTLVYW